jgi:hypothetical protein
MSFSVSQRDHSDNLIENKGADGDQGGMKAVFQLGKHYDIPNRGWWEFGTE